VLASAGEHIIGIVVDAGTDIRRRWQQLTGRLAARTYRHLPLQPDASGTIIELGCESVLPRLPGEVKFSDLARPKVLLHTYLARQAVPGNPFGTAMRRGDLRSDTPDVDAFMAWLPRLYSEGSCLGPHPYF
jgi:hypothetical protein